MGAVRRFVEKPCSCWAHHGGGGQRVGESAIAGEGQTAAFAETESLRFLRNREGFTLPTITAEDLTAVTTPVRRILDAGCGTGINLEHLVNLTGASRGVGVEPSAQSVDQLRRDHSDDPRLTFETASIHQLPFASNSFDLVVCWSVLHWVGRDEYLQALGELARVTSQWLVIMDFVAAEDYRVPYHHRYGLFTYKMDFAVPLAASGLVDTVSVVRWWEPEAGGERIPLDQKDLLPFRERALNYHARKVCTFRKNPDRLQLLDEADFTPRETT